MPRLACATRHDIQRRPSIAFDHAFSAPNAQILSNDGITWRLGNANIAGIVVVPLYLA